MRVEEVRATFNQTEKYLNRNTSILVRVNLIRNMLKTILYKNIIEIGCGDGSIGLSILDENKELTLLDISEKMIVRAKEKTPSLLCRKVEYVVEDIYTYQPRKKYDLVICVGVLAHVPSIEDLLIKIGSILSESGHLILQFTESHSLFGWFNYKFMNKTYGGYKVNKTCYRDLVPLLSKLNLKLISKKVYSGSAFLLSHINPSLGYKFKLLTSRLLFPYIFSEVIILLERRGNKISQENL